MKTALHISILMLILLTSTYTSQAQITSAGSGNWSDGSTWTGGVIPAENSDIIIQDGDKVKFDTDAVINNLTVNGTLEFEITTPRSLTVKGNLIADSIKTASLTTTDGPIIHHIFLYKNLSVTSLFDLRYGSNPNVGAAELHFMGSSNSTLSGPSNMDLNGVEVNKTGGAKIILASNFFQNNNSTNLPTGTLTLTNGIIETGNFEWHVKATSENAGISGGSPDSYINGSLVRYLPSGSMSRVYPIGDGQAFRPVKIHLLSSVSNSGFKCSLINAEANTGTSTLSGDIDKVSLLRYYAFQNISNNNLGFKFLEPSYRTDDGVESGNTDLRVALSVDERATWINKGPDDASHITTLTDPPVYIKSDSLNPALTVSGQGKFYVALARKTGSISNPLPVELVSFNASAFQDGILLKWATASETQNRGFDVERSTDKVNFKTVGFVNGSGSTSEIKNYSFIDKQAVISDVLYYRLKQHDYDGSYQYSDVISATLEVPVEYSVAQNYPNPFNPSTTLSYKISEPGNVSLNVYDVLGNLVRTVVSEFQETGSYSYSVDFKDQSSGTYIYELKVNSFTSRNKMLLIK